ncbi:MAG: phage baseplate assembly protein V [Ahrensia sp.]|nr:phage baseplate assembly protein V [Ahrensia sp.]
MRQSSEYAKQHNKRGIDRRPEKCVKVKFDDEDDTVSMWVDVLAKSSGSTKTFMMPNVDDEVWCSLDAKGSERCVMGSKYNDSETPPSDNDP